jgi:tetratricopeptide (TPR) repeat protein
MTIQDEDLAGAGRSRRSFGVSRNCARRFAAYLNEDKARERILYLYGASGAGKTTLLNYLRGNLCKRLFPEDWRRVKEFEGDGFVGEYIEAEAFSEVPSALVDFGLGGEHRFKEAFFALLKIRRDLSRSGLFFPIYDFASILYLHKTGRLCPETLNGLFPQEEMDLIAEMAAMIKRTPGANLTKSAMEVFSLRAQDWFLLRQDHRKSDEKLIDSLQGMKPESELYETLPLLFAEDLNTSLANKDAPQRVALFFDTHEALLGVKEEGAAGAPGDGEEWFRRLLRALFLERGVVVVVAGGEEPGWAERPLERIADHYVDACPVEGVSRAAAAAYLRASGVNDQETIDVILDHARAPGGGVHSFKLGLCADVAISAVRNGTGVAGEAFPDAPEPGDGGEALIDRLRQREGAASWQSVAALSACRSFDRNLYADLMETMKLGRPAGSFDRLREFSFVLEIEGRDAGRYRVHELLRRSMSERKDPTTLAAHCALAKRYQAMGDQGGAAAVAEMVYHVNQFDPERGVNAWADQMGQALNGGRHDLCRALIGVRDELSIPGDFDRGLIYIQEGQYYATLSQPERGRRAYQGAVAAFESALGRAPDDRFAYNNKGTALRRLADLQAELTQYGEARESYRRAIVAYDEAIERSPDDLFAHSNKGIALRRLGDLQSELGRREEARDSYRQAIAAYDEALRHAPEDGVAYINKGNALRRLGDLQSGLGQHKEARESYRGAIAAYDEALRRDPGDLSAQNNREVTLRRLGDLQSELAKRDGAQDAYRQAIATYDEALQRSPDDGVAYNNRGNALRRLGDLQAESGQDEEARESYRQAIASYYEALRRAPHDVVAYNNKGNVVQRLGDLQAESGQREEAMGSYMRAIAIFDEALGQAPEDLTALVNRGIALGRLGELQGGMSLREDARESYRRAVESYDEALRRDPDDASAHDKRGNAMQRLGDLQAESRLREEALDSYRLAVESYDEALRRKPDDLFAHNNKGIALRKLGDMQTELARPEEAWDSYRQAVDSYDQALRHAPDYVSAHTNRGNALQRLGDLQAEIGRRGEARGSYLQAIDSYDEALTRSQDDLVAHINKGNALQRLGDLQAETGQRNAALESYRQAIVSYDEALRHAPDYVSAHTNRGLAWGSLGDLQAELGQREAAQESFRQAIDSYDSALRYEPDYASAQANKGFAMGRLNELREGVGGR